MKDPSHSSIDLNSGSRYRSPPLLVGRVRERKLLIDELASTIDGFGRLVLIGGEAGIGKTALARNLVVDAERFGTRCITVHCFDVANTPPYAPWLEIFRLKDFDSDWPSAPDAFDGGELGQVTDQAALFADVRRFFSDLATIQPLCLVLEDLHWGDLSSIELLRFISRSLGQSPILIVATYRKDELTKKNPLYQALPSLVREAGAARMELNPLDSDALEMLVEARYHLHKENVVRLAAYLQSHTDGNPFYVLEVLRSLEDQGLLGGDPGQSTLDELVRFVVPPLLRQVIDARIARIGEIVREPLQMAAVIGQEVPLELWAKLAEVGPNELLELAEKMIDAHLMEAMDDGTHVRFVHALTRDAIYESIFPPRRRIWHQRVGETLAELRTIEPDTVAFHFEQAGDPRAFEWLVRAGDRSQRAYAWIMAAQSFQSAADLIKDVNGQENVYHKLIVRVAFLLRFSYPDEAAKILKDAVGIAPRLEDVGISTLVSHLRGVVLCYSDQLRSGIDDLLLSHASLSSGPLVTEQAAELAEAWFAYVVSEPAPMDRRTVSSVIIRLRDAGFEMVNNTVYWFLASSGQPTLAVTKETAFLQVFANAEEEIEVVGTIKAFGLHGLAVASAVLGKVAEARSAWLQARNVILQF